VVSEAIALGIPVIASEIPGNRGLLGDDYLAYYPVDNEVALASLLYRSETVPDFYSALKKTNRNLKRSHSPKAKEAVYSRIDEPVNEELRKLVILKIHH